MKREQRKIKMNLFVQARGGSCVRIRDNKVILVVSLDLCDRTRTSLASGRLEAIRYGLALLKTTLSYLHFIDHPRTDW